MTSPLPDGCKFFIYPDYRIDYGGKIIVLGKDQAHILLILMSKPGRPFSASEIAMMLYDGREDGGPYCAASIISKQIFEIRKKFTKRGLSLNLKTGNSHYNFVYRPSSISLMTRIERIVSDDGGWTFPARCEARGMGR